MWEYSGGLARTGQEVGANWVGWRDGVGRRGRLRCGVTWWGGCGVCVCVCVLGGWEKWSKPITTPDTNTIQV